MLSFIKSRFRFSKSSKGWAMDFLKIDKIKKDYAIKGKKLSGEGVRVCIIDTGFNREVDILADRKVSGLDFDSDLVAEIMDALQNQESGINIVNYFQKNPFHKPIEEDVGGALHGSDIMAFIASKKGIAPRCDLFFAKIYENDGGNPKLVDKENSIALAIFWAISQCVKVINISSVQRNCSSLLTLAVREAYERGVIIICGSGNSNSVSGSEPLSESVEYPGAFQKTLAIGAFDEEFELWRTGDMGRLVDFVAPGKRVKSLIAGKVTGTSYSSAIISGIITLFIEKWKDERPNDEFNYQTLKEFLVITSLRPKGEFSHIGWAYGIIYPLALFSVFNQNIDQLIKEFRKKMQNLIHADIPKLKNIF